jgi:hypothetical protein
MTEPQRNYGAIDACLQQLHRSAVSEHVRRYLLGRQRRTALAGDTHMLGQKRLDAVGAKADHRVYLGITRLRRGASVP